MSDDKSSNQGHTMPLPDDADSGASSSDLAADLIRQKVQAAYVNEPDASTEALDVAQLGSSLPRSKHQQFIYDLTSSGKSLPEIQAAWHQYYAGLSDVEKHQVWQEFYSAHAQTANDTSGPTVLSPVQPVAQPYTPGHTPLRQRSKAVARTLGELRDSLLANSIPRKRLRPKQQFQSLFFGLGVGSVVVLVFMFSFFNERFIAPFIQPSRNITNTPIISGSVAGANPAVIIPKINVDIPVVYGVNSIKEVDIQQALEGGVVHYADTAVPGQGGNIVIVGHSSNNIFNRGSYKFAFVLLSRLENKDTFYLDKDGKRYTYEIFEKKVVKPTDTSVLAPKREPATATLITCDPPGTSTNRLVVVGKQISPDPLTNTPEIAQNSLAIQASVVPGNSPSLWSRLIGWFSR